MMTDLQMSKAKYLQEQFGDNVRCQAILLHYYTLSILMLAN
jgi:hypothetical protein